MSAVVATRPARPIVRITPDPAGIPDELKARDQWVCWRLEWREGGKNGKPGQWAKVLCDPRTGAHASVDEPATWATFAAAWSAYQRGGYDGIGFVFTASDPYAGADFDKCRDAETGELTSRAQTGVDSLATYTEISPSGAGVHCILRAVLPHADPDKQTGKRRDGVELYDRGRYFTFTGKRLDGTPPTIEDCQDEAEGLYGQLASGGKGKTGKHANKPTATAQPAAALDMADADVIALGLAERGGKFARLWAGDTSGYGTPSEARAALVQKLRWYVREDAGRIERMMRQSGLFEPRWDDMRGDQSFIAYDIARILQLDKPTTYYGDPRARGQDDPLEDARRSIWGSTPDRSRARGQDDPLEDARAAAETEADARGQDDSWEAPACGCATCDAIRRENANLRRELEKERTRRREAERETAWMRQLIAVPSAVLSTTDKIVAMAAIDEHAEAWDRPEVVRAEQRMGKDEGHKIVYRERVARRAGISESSAGDSMQRLERVGALSRVPVYVAPRPLPGQDPEEPVSRGPQDLRMAIKPTLTLLHSPAKLQAPEGEERKHGGKRTPGPVCPHCGVRHGRKLRGDVMCMNPACGKIIKRGAELVIVQPPEGSATHDTSAARGQDDPPLSVINIPVNLTPSEPEAHAHAASAGGCLQCGGQDTYWSPVGLLVCRKCVAVVGHRDELATLAATG